MRSFIFSLLIIIVSFVIPSDIEKQISTAIMNSDAEKLASFFKNTVEFELNVNRGLYSKAQAQIILKDFFTKNKTKELKLVSRISEGASVAFVYQMTSVKGKVFFIFYKLILDKKPRISYFKISSAS